MGVGSDFNARTIKERNRRFTGNGAISMFQHPEYENPTTGFQNPFKGIMDAMAEQDSIHKARSEQMDNDIAKARGQRAYYEGSPSRTKGRLAIKMGGR